jgi:uncharacterized protein (TIGR02001 family)
MLSVYTSSVLAEDVEPEFNVDAAITSNYIWRGMTQSQDTPVLQGGFGASFMGLHANLWSSGVTYKEDNKSEIYELDYSAGYTFKYESLELDVSYCAITYPDDENLNFSESKITLSSSFDNIKLGYSYSGALDQNKTYNTDGGNSEALITIGDLDIVYGDYKDVGTYYTISYSKPYRKIKATISYSSGLQASSDEDSNTTSTKIDRSEDPRVFLTISYIFD